MSEQNDTNFTLDVEPTDQYLKRLSADIKKSHARTANLVALILVGAVVASLPLYVLFRFVLLWCGKDASPLDSIFDKWYSVISPLAGVAVGAYYVSSSK